MMRRMIKSYLNICRYPDSGAVRQSRVTQARRQASLGLHLNLIALIARETGGDRRIATFSWPPVDLLHFLFIFREATEQLADNSQLSSKLYYYYYY